MGPKITYDVLDAHQHCRRKAYFRLSGEVESEFETLAFEARQELRPRIIAKIQQQFGKSNVETDLSLSVSVLRKGIPFILNGKIEDDLHSIRLDGLKRVDGGGLSRCPR